MRDCKFEKKRMNEYYLVRSCSRSMDCVGQPAKDSEFHSDFKSGFSFSVRLISISVETSNAFGCFENVYVFFSAAIE